MGNTINSLNGINTTTLADDLIKEKNYNNIIECLLKCRLSLGEKNVYRLLNVFLNSDQPLIKHMLISKKDYIINATRKEFRFILAALIDEPSTSNCMCLIKLRQLFTKEEFEEKVKSVHLTNEQKAFLNGVLLSNNL